MASTKIKKLIVVRPKIGAKDYYDKHWKSYNNYMPKNLKLTPEYLFYYQMHFDNEEDFQAFLKNTSHPYRSLHLDGNKYGVNFEWKHFDIVDTIDLTEEESLLFRKRKSLEDYYKNNKKVDVLYQIF